MARATTNKPVARRRRGATTDPGPDRGPDILTDDDFREAEMRLAEAFALCAKSPDICPKCGQDKPAKYRIKTSKTSGLPYAQCFSGGGHMTMAIEMVRDTYGIPRTVAAKVLLGRMPMPRGAARRAGITPGEIVPITTRPTFQATVDAEVYEALLASKHCSAAKAAAYYSARHIDPAVVARFQVTWITDADALTRELVDTFGEDRLIQAGLAMEADTVDGPGDKTRARPFRLICSSRYPIVEPAITPAGRVVNLQFRCSPAQRRKVDAHKADKDKHAYVPKFLSLRGQTEQHLIGLGLHLLEDLKSRPARTPMYVCEGLVDTMAVYSEGGWAYGLPGAGMSPPDQVLAFFKKMDVEALLAFDGDEAGEAGIDRLEELFEAKHLPTRRKSLPDGVDIADQLAARHTERGCTCPRG